MNTVLIILQIGLVIKLLTVSYTHAFQWQKEEMKEAIENAGSTVKPILILSAASSFLISIALLLPLLFNIPPLFTSITSFVLSGLILISIFFHVKFRRKLKIFAGVIILVIAGFVGLGSLGLI